MNELYYVYKNLDYNSHNLQPSLENIIVLFEHIKIITQHNIYSAFYYIPEILI